MNINSHYYFINALELIFNLYYTDIILEVSIKNSKIRFVRTWCIFETQKPQVVFDGLFGIELLKGEELLRAAFCGIEKCAFIVLFTYQKATTAFCGIEKIIDFVKMLIRIGMFLEEIRRGFKGI